MDGRLKRLHHKCKYMGMHENDVIFSRFAERFLNDLPENEVQQFEVLVDENDIDIFRWITGKQEVPAHHENEVMAKLRTCQDYIENDFCS